MTVLTINQRICPKSSFVHFQQVAVMNKTYFNVFAVIGFINPCLNPFIYAARYEVFKRSLKEILNRENQSSRPTAGGRRGHANM